MAPYLHFPPYRTDCRHSCPVRCFKEVSGEGCYLWPNSHKPVSNLILILMAAHQSVSQLSCLAWNAWHFQPFFLCSKQLPCLFCLLGYKNEINKPTWSSNDSFGVQDHASEKTCNISSCLSSLEPLPLLQRNLLCYACISPCLHMASFTYTVLCLSAPPVYTFII